MPATEALCTKIHKGNICIENWLETLIINDRGASRRPGFQNPYYWIFFRLESRWIKKCSIIEEFCCSGVGSWKYYGWVCGPGHGEHPGRFEKIFLEAESSSGGLGENILENILRNILEAESSSGGLGERQRGELDGEGSTLGDHRKNFRERSARGI